MKANEFVKRFGWDEAQKCLPYCSKRGDFIYYKNIEVNFNDLKRLVESHELVEAYGGYDLAKEVKNITPLRKASYDLIESLKQAIADVESCQ